MEKLQQQYEELKGDLLQKIFAHKKEMNTTVNVRLSQAMVSTHILERNIKNTKKELTSIFRKQNKELIAQYKQAKQAYKQAGGVDEPKYIQDKQSLEKSLEKLGVDVDTAMSLLSEREKEILVTYFAWEDIRKLSEKYGMVYKRIVKMKDRTLRKTVGNIVYQKREQEEKQILLDSLGMSEDVAMMSITDDMKELSKKIRDILSTLEVHTVFDLFAYTKEDYLKCRDMGTKRVDEIEKFKMYIKEKYIQKQSKEKIQ